MIEVAVVILTVVLGIAAWYCLEFVAALVYCLGLAIGSAFAKRD